MARWKDLAALQAWREQWMPQVRLLPKAGARLLTAVVVLQIAVGLLPVAVIVAISAAIAHAPQAARSGASSPAASTVMLALVIAAGAFCLVQLLAPMATALGILLQQRVDGYCVQRLMRGALLRAPYSALEDSRVLDPLTDAAVSLESGWSTPGAACAGMMALIARYGQLAAALALVAALYSPWPALLLLLVALMIRRGRRSWQRQERQLWRDLSSARRKVLYMRRLGTGPVAAKEIRIFGLIEWLCGHYSLDADAFLGPLSVMRRRVGMRPFFYYSSIAFLCGSLAFFLLISNFASSQLSLFDFMLFLQTIRIALLFGDNFPECDDSLTFGNRAFNSMLDFEKAAGISSAAGYLPQASETVDEPQTVRFEHVGFRYGGDGPLVLRDLCLTLPAGTSTAIVGLNGAGKTTLIKLLTKLYDPTSGHISVGTADLADLAEVEWQRRVAIIFQDFNRYELSAAENIGFGAVQHLNDIEGIRAAASEAGILDAIESLPRGLQTPLSRQHDGGTDLSGGQWQRIALARVMFAVRHGAQLLVLDEPTAQLDARAEVEFFDRFLDLTQGTTSVVISHRFSTVRQADHIVMLEDGHIVEGGTHDELVRLGGRYARLFSIQARQYLSDDDSPSMAGTR